MNVTLHLVKTEQSAKILSARTSASVLKVFRVKTANSTSTIAYRTLARMEEPVTTSLTTSLALVLSVPLVKYVR